MNIPVSVQADALQVLPSPVPTDYTSLTINALAIVVGTVIGVFLGYLLSERQRRKIEAVTVANTVSYDFHYAMGAIVRQQIALMNWLNWLNENTQYFLKNEKLLSHIKLNYFNFDYKIISRLLKYIPDVVNGFTMAELSVILVQDSMLALYGDKAKDELDSAMKKEGLKAVLSMSLHSVEKLEDILSKIEEASFVVLPLLVHAASNSHATLPTVALEASRLASFDETLMNSRALLKQLEKAPQ